MRRQALVVGVVASLSLVAAHAHADDVVIIAPDGTPWMELVDEIQNDPSTEGRTYAIEVKSGGQPAHCGDYTLALDEISARAFRIEGCDPRSSATTLRVVDRTALFEPGSVVPRARRAILHATIVESGAVEGGGGAPRASTDLSCSVELMPTLWDALHGIRVPLTPDRFDLISIDGDVAVASAGPGWEARGESHAALRFRYEAIERATGNVVLTSTATLECADTETTAMPTTFPDTTIPTLATPRPTPRIGWDLMVSMTRLTRSTTSIQNDDGMPLSSAMGARELSYTGATLGWDFRFDWVTFVMNYTMAHGDDGMASVWTFGLGATYTHDSLAWYVAPAMRVSLLSVNGVIGPVADIDASLIVGAHYHVAGPWEITTQVTAPLSSTEWALTAGIGNRFGIF